MIANQTLTQEQEKCIYQTDDSLCELMKSCRCHSQDCTFRQTKHQSEQSADAWRVRLKSLPEDQQLFIAKKYYGGNMPWKSIK